ncbi:phage portal protein [Salininema proteolyticum]|uniref:Phage portal protein n=1 Tax=Salininema proteolyticum TaxID=1607685 RepID=A0ABV8TSZ2_9ACTN
MGLIRSAWTPSSLATPERWLVDGFGGPETAAGVRVDEDTANYYSPFFAGVNVIANDVASLPLPLYRRMNRGKERADDHPLYEILHDQPNPLMSSLTFRRTLQGHALTWGNGYAHVVNNGAGQVVELWPLHPGRIWPEKIARGNGTIDLWWRYSDPENGIQTRLAPDEVLHIAGLGADGIQGYSIVELARNAIGLGLATETYGAKFFGNGSRPGGVLRKKEGKLSDEARKRLKVDWENLHQGLDAAQRVAILEEGLEWQSIGIPNNDAQFLETRKMQVTELARWLRLPPHKIGDLERATFSNIESQQIDYVTSALMAWLVTWEQSVKRTLLTPTERRSGLFAEHIVDSLLRGDTQARFAAYATARQWGWMSANDVRERENMNAVPDGDIYLTPLNMVPAGEATATSGQQSKPTLAAARLVAGRSHAARERIAEAFKPKIVDADARTARLEKAEVSSLARRHLGERGRAAGRSIASFMTAVRELYEGLVTDRATKAWLPVFTVFAAEVAADAAADVGHDEEIDLDRWVDAYVSSHIAYRAAAAVGELNGVVSRADRDGEDVAAAVLARMTHWVDTRPGRTAKWESHQMLNAASREAWKAAGIRRMTWNAVGDNCPACVGLDGRIVGIDEPFAGTGDEITMGEDATTRLEHDMLHPPLHPGCDCTVEPA